MNKDSISHIVSALGKPVRLDTNTANEIRLNYAQVLVEISGRELKGKIRFPNYFDKSFSIKVLA